MTLLADSILTNINPETKLGSSSLPLNHYCTSGMPLYTADGSIDTITLRTVPEQFIIFYSSIVDGQMWCPDCRAVDRLVKETFSTEGPAALIVYVGNKEQWKTPSNAYRQEPWKVSGVPTIVKLKDGREVARLNDDEDISKNLSTFVAS